MIRTILLLLLISSASFAQLSPLNFHLQSKRTLDIDPEPRLRSSVIIDIVKTSDPNLLWLATGTGVTKTTIIPLPEFEEPYQFNTYSVEQGLGKGGVSGILWTDSILWTSFAFDTSVGISGAGGGLAYSRDNGNHWTSFPQPRDRIYNINPSNGQDLTLGYWPTATNVDNITYDIAMSDSFIWIVSKGGGLRRHAFAENYTDYNDTTGWKLISPDNQPFHPAQIINHITFAVLYAENKLFVGTAGGINISSDNGRTWTNKNSGNSGISGNFITAMSYQQATHTIWAASWRAEGANEFYAVSKSTDGGNTWTATLTPEQVEAATGMQASARAHNFGFDSLAVYVCDDIGLWKSVDGGTDWELFGQIVDEEDGHRFYEPEIYAATKAYDRLWIGGVDGLAVSQNNGGTWKIFQAAEPLNGSRKADTYAYPCPWSPARFGPVKLRYSMAQGGTVRISIYDFSMSKVTELPVVSRSGGEQYEVWDGKKGGDIVANGTYFYKIEKPGGEVWGKLIVLD